MSLNTMRTLILSIATVTFLVLLALANFSIMQFQLSKQSAFTERLLAPTERVVQDVMTAIDEAQEKPLEQCSSASIDEFQLLANYHYFVYDIGLIDKDTLVCTANWGLLDSPPPLIDKQSQETSALKIYTDTNNLFPADLPLVAFRVGSIAAFASLDFYAQYSRLAPDFSYRILSQGPSQTLASYEALDSEAFELPFLYQQIQQCSDTLPICIDTNNKRSGILYLSAPALIVVVLICALLSALLTYWWASVQKRRASMEHRFQEALKHKRLHLAYQPIVDARSEHIVGVESLLRWHDERLGHVSPEFVIQMAEELSLYAQLSEFIVDTALSEMEALLRSDFSFFLALNVSSYEILHLDYLDALIDKVTSKGINPSQIKLEITERVELDIPYLRAFSQKAKGLGFIVALDDFGTGLANLVWLTEIDFSEIKIDRIFTQSLSNDLKRELVTHIIVMINQLNKPLIFEGIEHPSELAHIKQLCDSPKAQGWLFYRAMPKDELESILGKHSL